MELRNENADFYEEYEISMRRLYENRQLRCRLNEIKKMDVDIVKGELIKMEASTFGSREALSERLWRAELLAGSTQMEVPWYVQIDGADASVEKQPDKELIMEFNQVREKKNSKQTRLTSERRVPSIRINNGADITDDENAEKSESDRMEGPNKINQNLHLDGVNLSRDNPAREREINKLTSSEKMYDSRRGLQQSRPTEDNRGARKKVVPLKDCEASGESSSDSEEESRTKMRALSVNRRNIFGSPSIKAVPEWANKNLELKYREPLRKNDRKVGKADLYRDQNLDRCKNEENYKDKRNSEYARDRSPSYDACDENEKHQDTARRRGRCYVPGSHDDDTDLSLRQKRNKSEQKADNKRISRRMSNAEFSRQLSANERCRSRRYSRVRNYSQSSVSDSDSAEEENVDSGYSHGTRGRRDEYENRNTREEREYRRRRGDSRSREDRAQKLHYIKLLQSWKISFSGEGNDSAEEYLAQLENCKRAADISGKDLIEAIPCTLTKSARRWYSSLSRSVSTWTEFKSEFRHQFMRRRSDDDVMDDLRNRTQAKNGRITSYLSCIRLLLNMLKRPLTDYDEVKIVLRNLAPDYRRYMSGKQLYDLRDIDHYGREWEEELALEKRYHAPPPRDRCWFPEAAYIAPKGRVAASEEAAMSIGENKEKQSKKTKKKGKNKKVRENESMDVREEEEVNQIGDGPRPQVQHQSYRVEPRSQGPSAQGQARSDSRTQNSKMT